MQRQEIRRRVDVLGPVEPLGAELTKAFRRDKRVVRDDAHAEAGRTPCDLLPDPAEPEHA